MASLLPPLAQTEKHKAETSPSPPRRLYEFRNLMPSRKTLWYGGADEKETQYPPARLIVPLAKALGVSSDELFGMREAKADLDPAKAALWRRLKLVETLLPIDRKAILHYIITVAKTETLVKKLPNKAG